MVLVNFGGLHTLRVYRLVTTCTYLGDLSRATQRSIAGINIGLARAPCVANDDGACALAAALIAKYNSSVYSSLGDGPECECRSIGSNTDIVTRII